MGDHGHLLQGHGMHINIIKSLILYWGLLENEKNHIYHVFPYQVGDLDTSLK